MRGGGVEFWENAQMLWRGCGCAGWCTSYSYEEQGCGCVMMKERRRFTGEVGVVKKKNVFFQRTLPGALRIFLFCRVQST